MNRSSSVTICAGPSREHDPYVTPIIVGAWKQVSWSPFGSILRGMVLWPLIKGRLSWVLFYLSQEGVVLISVARHDGP